MVLETPLLKVSRPVAACSRCRSAKIRCDGKLPACTACEKAQKSSDCSSTNEQFARGKERSYVATLEAHVEKLEQRIELARARRKSSTFMLDLTNLAASRRISEGVPTKVASFKAERKKEAAAVEELVSDFGYLAVNSTTRDIHGIATPLTYARLILSASVNSPLPSISVKQLPPRHTIMPLVERFFEHSFVSCPAFEETTFYGSLDAVYQQDLKFTTPFDHWLVRLVLAISSASVSMQHGDHAYNEAVEHIAAALQFAELVLRPSTTSSIQALILLSQYAILDPYHFNSWQLVGATSRAMIDLGFHQNPSRGSGIPKPKIELRRRIFWCIYMLDRAISIAESRAFSFSDESCLVPYPSYPGSATPLSRVKNTGENEGIHDRGRIETISFTHPLTPNLRLLFLRQIQSEWYMRLFQSGRTVLTEIPSPEIGPKTWSAVAHLKEWRDNTPPNIPRSLHAYLEREYLYTRTLLLGPSPRQPLITLPAQHALFDATFEYAENIHDVIAELTRDSDIVTTLNFLDVHHAHDVGHRILHLFEEYDPSILETNLPEQGVPSSDHDPVPVIAVGSETASTKAVKAVRSIGNILDFLEILCHRWPSATKFREEFRQNCQNILSKLSPFMRGDSLVASDRVPNFSPQFEEMTGQRGSVYDFRPEGLQEVKIAIPGCDPFTVSTQPSTIPQPITQAQDSALVKSFMPTQGSLSAQGSDCQQFHSWAQWKGFEERDAHFPETGEK